MINYNDKSHSTSTWLKKSLKRWRTQETLSSPPLLMLRCAEGPISLEIPPTWNLGASCFRKTLTTVQNQWATGSPRSQSQYKCTIQRNEIITPLFGRSFFFDHIQRKHFSHSTPTRIYWSGYSTCLTHSGDSCDRLYGYSSLTLVPFTKPV